MKFQEAIRSLKFNKDTRFVLSGPEYYLKEQFIQASKVVYPRSQFLMFYPDMQDEALEVFQGGNFFGDRIIVLRQFNDMKMDLFISALEKPSKDCVILVLSEGATKTKPITKVISLATEVECNRMREYGDDYPIWISAKASERGFVMREHSEAQLYGRTGSNMFAIVNELKKLFLYKGDTGVITSDDVLKVVSETMVSTTYSIFECLLKRDIAGALRGFESYCRVHDNQMELVSFLGTYLEKLYRMVLMRDKKFSERDIGGILNIPEYLVKTKYLPKALSLGLDVLGARIGALCDLDVRMRQFKGDKRRLMEAYFFSYAE